MKFQVVAEKLARICPPFLFLFTPRATHDPEALRCSIAKSERERESVVRKLRRHLARLFPFPVESEEKLEPRFPLCVAKNSSFYLCRSGSSESVESSKELGWQFCSRHDNDSFTFYLCVSTSHPSSNQP